MKSSHLLFLSWAGTFVVSIWFASFVYSAKSRQPLSPNQGNEWRPIGRDAASLNAAATAPAITLEVRKEMAWKTDANWWVAIATAGLIITGLLQVVLFYWQLRIIRRSQVDTRLAAKTAMRSARSMDMTAKRQLRAYVQVVPCGIFGLNAMNQDGSYPVSIEFRLDNFGQTPANNFVLRGGAFIAPAPLPGDYPIPSISGQETYPTVIFPNGTLSKQQKPTIKVTFEERLRHEDSVLIEQDEQKLYVFGSGRYDDVFGEPRDFDFCHWLDCNGPNWWIVRRTTPWAPPVEVKAIVAAKGNRFD